MASRAGCVQAEVPIPRPYHLPVHQARLTSSCLYSLEMPIEMSSLKTKRWILHGRNRVRRAFQGRVLLRRKLTQRWR
jgi:hypothetical protein